MPRCKGVRNDSPCGMGRSRIKALSKRKRRGLRIAIAVLLAATVSMSATGGENTDRKPYAGGIDETCKRSSDGAGPKWSEAEHLLWMRVCSGMSIDFREAKNIDPTIRSEVLREIVTRDTVSETAKRKRIGILGMHVPGALDLSDTDIDRALIIAVSTVDGDVRLNRVRTRAVVSFGGSSVGGAVQVHGAEIGGSLILREAQIKAIEINSTRIEGWSIWQGHR